MFLTLLLRIKCLWGVVGVCSKCGAGTNFNYCEFVFPNCERPVHFVGRFNRDNYLTDN
jgi:hypothetical protein